ncbi:MAG TPA: hypothetical protein VFT56_16675 [Sphingomonas sp.]|nr:hypothetical protein [Sphingomonas sp.]
MTDFTLPVPRPAHRLAAVVTPRTMTTRLPLKIVFGYVVTTFALFVVWPIDWPIYSTAEWARLVGYVALCFIAIGGGALAGSTGETRVTAPLPLMTLLLVAGAAVSAALLEPSSYAYTGRTLREIGAALSDQGAAYRRLQAQLFATTGQRDMLVVIRALLSPLTYAVLPLGVIRWRTIGWIGRLAVVVAVVCSICFSIMRGTDKEIADLFIIGIAAAFVSYGRHRALGLRGFDLVRRYWKQALIALVFLYFAQGMFTTRKDERLGGGYASRTAVCANDSHICANLDNPLISWLPERQSFGLTFFILSTCSGYYGLDLALEKPFESTYGVGHSPAAMSAYETLTGDPSLHLHSFTYRNGDDGWSEDYYWSTLMTWIANDVGFPGTVAVLVLIGLMWGKWWREAAAGMSDPAAVLFTIATMAMVYLPANNQVLGSYDGYVTLTAWIVIWLWHRFRYPLSALVADA